MSPRGFFKRTDLFPLVADALGKDQTERIERLAVHLFPADPDFAYFETFADAIFRFRGLKHLTVVLPENDTFELPDVLEGEVFEEAESGGQGSIPGISRIEIF